jgi:hypothetical protein
MIFIRVSRNFARSSVNPRATLPESVSKVEQTGKPNGFIHAGTGHESRGTAGSRENSEFPSVPAARDPSKEWSEPDEPPSPARGDRQWPSA